MSAEHTVGNYVLGPVLGRGGMSEIRAAEHRFLGDRVAIKLLRSHVARAPGAAEAFLAEATRTRAIEHPNVVRVLDFGVDGDDFYLVMERLDGESLAERLARGGPLGEPELRELGAAIADGMAAAHARGIVHRDLKPANVMLAPEPKIVDFGIARELAPDGATVTGSRIGTLAYMAPEQLAGGLVAPCVDVWALGVLLFEACTCGLPFADFTDGRAPQLVDAAPRLRTRAEVSAGFDALVAACLERDPRDRPASMREIAAALRGAPMEQRFTEDLPPVNETVMTVKPRRRLGMAIAALSVIAIAAIGVTAALRAPAPEAAPRPAQAPASVAVAPPPPPASVAVAPPPSPVPPPVTAVTIEVRSAPAGANVVIAGKRVGVTPATLAVELPAAIVVTRAGYQPARLTAEHPGPIDVRLVPARRPHRPNPERAGETLD